jgi:hypothetical protein
LLQPRTPQSYLAFETIRADDEAYLNYAGAGAPPEARLAAGVAARTVLYDEALNVQ